MKKFLIILILLLILGGTAFFYGWVQFSVPPGSWGVMRSKTHGLEETLIRPGEFRWVWYKLIPTNVEILVFAPERVSRSLLGQGRLRSGETYAALGGISADFSWEIGVDFSFSLDPYTLPALVERESIATQGDLRAFSGKLAAQIQTLILDRLQRYAEREEDEGFLPALETEIRDAYPEIAGFSCFIRPVTLPDLALYRSIQRLYEDYLQKQREFLGSGLENTAEFRISSQLRFDELERYGELLTRYPILLRYLAVESGLPEPAAAE